MCIKLPWLTRTFRSERIEWVSPDDPGVSDRQDRVPGFETAKLQSSRVLMIGAGGLGSEVCTGLARKGIGHLQICDHDCVEVSNLARQYYNMSDLWQPKALRLAKNVAGQGFLGSEVVGHVVAFGQATAGWLAADIQVAVCGVDNNGTRAIASQFFRQHKVPIIFMAINEGANYGWIFLQEPTGPCLGCVFPRAADPGTHRQPCTPVGAVLDVIRILGGMTLYAVDSLLMSRRRDWNFRSINLIGDVPDVIDTVKARPGCRLCQPAEA